MIKINLYSTIEHAVESEKIEITLPARKSITVFI